MKNYEKHWTSKAAPGGQRTVWVLPFPSEATLVKLVVKQVGGPASAFTVDIFNSEKAVARSQSSGGEDPDGDYAPDPDLYRVCPTISSDAPGKLLKWFDGSEGNYVNMDAAGATNKKRLIYVEIEPASAGDMTFDVALGAVTDVG